MPKKAGGFGFQGVPAILLEEPPLPEAASMLRSRRVPGHGQELFESAVYGHTYGMISLATTLFTQPDASDPAEQQDRFAMVCSHHIAAAEDGFRKINKYKRGKI